MGVVSVDDAKKLLVCKFGGAISGEYSIRIHHAQYGLLDTKSLTLKVESHYSNITPTTGSIYGGTLVTLTGINWGSELTDNPVEISYNGALGSTKCYLQSTSETEIKCRVDSSRTLEAGKVGKMLVFLKTYEEANCTMAGNCAWTFTDSVPEITAIAPEWDAASLKWTLKVTGTSITGSKDNTELLIGSAVQETASISGSEAIFKVIDAPSEKVAGINVYWEVGKGKGSELLTEQTLEPKLVSVSPKKGSAGGTIITLDVQGVGKATQGLDIVDGAGKSVCQSVTIVSYGVVKCHTIVLDMPAG